MQEKINLSGKEIDYNLEKSKRAHNLRLTVNLEGNLTVTVPWFYSFWQARRFIKKKSNWILRNIERFKKREGSSLLVRAGKRDYYRLKEEARTFAYNKVGEFNKFYNFDYNKISIRNQRSRWGSCSVNRNLNYNFRIVLLPENLANYIIIHELCHLKEMNHSKRFWKLVEKMVPDYKEMRKKLKNI
jgi:hypothetical protein